MQFKASGGGGGNNPHVIKLKAGESVTGILRGEPVEYEKAFNAESKPKFEFMLNMVVKENGALVAKILRGGWKIYSQLHQLSDAGWKLEECYTKVSRAGAGINDTVYSVTTLPQAPTPETIAQIKAVRLHDLNALTPGAPAAAPQGYQNEGHEFPPGGDDHVPF